MRHAPPQVEDAAAAAGATAPNIAPAAAQTTFRSVGKLGHLAGTLDLAEPGSVERLVQTRSHRGEIIMFIGTPTMAGWTFNFVNQLRGAGYEHWFILSDTGESCRRLDEMWAP